MRRPSVSAITPVGISKTAMAAVNAALARKTWKMVRPASSRKSVLMPQISDPDNVNSPLISRYVRITTFESTATRAGYMTARTIAACVGSMPRRG